MRRLRLRTIGVAIMGVSVAGATSGPAHPAAEQAVRVIEVSAERFSFTPSQIRMTLDAPIEIRLRSDDTDHGFRVLGTDIDVRIPKRGKGTMSVTFRPAKEGRYTFECSHVCGAGHAFMRGTIIVKER
jgi:cytochrome c oxidase subunit 2